MPEGHDPEFQRIVIKVWGADGRSRVKSFMGLWLSGPSEAGFGLALASTANVVGVVGEHYLTMFEDDLDDVDAAHGLQEGNESVRDSGDGQR